MESTFAQQCERLDFQRDEYHLHKPEKERLFPAFGLKKMLLQNELRYEHDLERAGAWRNALNGIRNAPVKKGDWAIMGGIAEAIGGVGAGIAAAAQTQINNLQAEATRASNAQLADLLGNLVGTGDPVEVRLTDADLTCVGIRVTTDTQTLFKALKCKIEYPKGAENAVLTKPLEIKSLAKRGQEIGDFYLTFTNNHQHRIDGYLRMVMKDAKGTPLWERELPLPVGGVRTDKDVKMIVKAPNAVTQIELQPIVLWEVVARDEPDAYAVREPEELPAKYDYPKVWKELLAKHEEQAGALHKKRHAIIKRNRMIGICVSVVALAIIAIGAFIYWQTSTFSFGRTMLSYGARQADENAFSKLPPWYHERIAAVYIKHARSGMEYTERSMSCLEYAERYATDAQQAEITDVRIRTLIHADDGKVIRDSGAGQARQEILRLYEQGQLTAEQVVGYAVSMTELYKDEQKNRMYNKLMHDVVYLAEMFREDDARAAALADTYGPMVNGYDEAVALVKKGEFAVAMEYFSQYNGYRQCHSYAGFCEDVLQWLGTWRNPAGDTLVIEMATENAFGYTTAIASEEQIPQYLNVTVTLNGELQNKRFRITEWFGDLECVNQSSIDFRYSGGKVTLKMPGKEYTGFVKQD